MRAIYKRELRSYFHSMIGYVFIAFLVAYTGIYFLAYNLNYGYPYFSYVLSGILFVYLVAIPILTMRCFAEDKKNKTDQMLLTAPVSLFEIVLGKYLAMVTITAVPCVIYLIFPLIIKAQGTAYIKVDYLAILVTASREELKKISGEVLRRGHRVISYTTREEERDGHTLYRVTLVVRIRKQSDERSLFEFIQSLPDTMLELME